MEQLAIHQNQGPGGGNLNTNHFMAVLRSRVLQAIGEGFDEQMICGPDNQMRVDFYIPKESTVIEIALNLDNPNSEYERDLFKVILAKKTGHSITTLILVGCHGAINRQNSPSSQAMRSLLHEDYQISVVIQELNSPTA